jgi:hypothetical protein
MSQRTSMGLILGLLLSLAALPAQAQQQNETSKPPFSIFISTPQREVKVGSRVIVNIILTNTSGRTIRMGGMVEYPPPQIYKMKVADEEGQMPPRTPSGRVLIDDGVVVGKLDLGRDFTPSEIFEQTIELTAFFVLDPSMYTLHLERGQGDATIKSNVITFRVVPDTQLEGSVLDQTGGAIPQANVVLFSDDRVLTTKANENGMFRFADVPTTVRFIEVSSPGFASASIPITDETPHPLSVKLRVGEYSGPPIMQCPPNMVPIPTPSVSYEPRPGNLQIAGIVTDLSGKPSALTFLTLQADLNALPIYEQSPFRPPEMKRPLNEKLIAELVSNDKGEFHFADLEPGSYTLKATRDDSSAIVSFWVARENLTLLSRIYLLPQNYKSQNYQNQCYVSPDVPTQDSPLPLTVKPPQN